VTPPAIVGRGYSVRCHRLALGLTWVRTNADCLPDVDSSSCEFARPHGVDTRDGSRQTGCVVDGQELDEVARLMAAWADFPSVWRIVGVRPGGEKSCEVELLVLSRVGGDRYRLRSVVAELDRINMVANHLFQASPPETSFRWEEITFATLEDALRCARTLSGASGAVPLLERTQRVNSVWFTGPVSRSKLRSQVDWLPQPPRWWDITKRVLIWAWWLLLVVPLVHLVVRVLMGDEYGTGDFVAGLSLWVVLLVVLYPAGLLGDRIERRLERPRDRS
jgi:hypothetical protein